MRSFEHLVGPQRSEWPLHPSDASTAALVAQNLALRRAMPLTRRSTNAIVYPYFDQGKWGKEGGATDVCGERYQVNTAGSVQNDFNYRALQLSPAAASTVQASSPVVAPIDLTQAYKVGLWGNGGGGVQTINYQVVAADQNGGALGAVLTVALTVPNGDNYTTSEQQGTINANGGGAPAWPNGTRGATFQVQNPTASTNKWVYGIYAVQSQKMPYTAAKANNGGGTHEGLWDGTNLFTLSHSSSQIAKFDSNLNRVAILATSSYPHDCVVLGGDIWVISNVGKQLQQINRAALTVTNTFALNGARTGFGIATDGTDLYLGVGDSGVAETPAIVKFTVSGSSQASLSTDVAGGSANIPVVFLAGSVWSISLTSVKRINPVGGATIATIAGGLNQIYGLGTDGTLLYAQAEGGIAVIDPATNTVISTYQFSTIWGLGSNMKASTDGRMWGAARNGIFTLDQATATFREYPHFLGSPKFFSQFPPGGAGAMVLGYYMMPSLDILC